MNWLRKLFGGAPKAAPALEIKSSTTITRSEPAWVFSFSSSAKPDDLLKSSAWVFACADRTVTALSAIPVNIRKGGEIIAWNSDHPLANVLREPIPDITWTQWLEEVGLYAILTGCCYLEKRRATAYGMSEKYPNLGYPIQLWPFGANAFKACVDSLARRQVIEEYEPKIGSDKTKLPPSEIVRIAYTRLGKRNEAMSKVEAVAREISTDQGAANFQESSLKNIGVPSGIIRVNGPLNTTQEQNTVNQMDAEWVGAQNARRPMIMGDGATWQDIAKSALDLDMMKGREFTRAAICAAMGVPEVIFNVANSTYANLETALVAHSTQTVLPLLNRIIDSLNMGLCREFGADIYLEADLSAVPALLPIMKSKWDLADRMMNRGAPLDSANDALELNAPRFPGSDVGFLPSTQIPVESLTTGDADLAPVGLRGVA